MAFGFLKKLVQKITGKDTSASKGGKGSSNGAKKDGGGGRGRRGKRGRHGNGGTGGGQQPRPQKQQQPRSSGQQQQQRPSGQQQQQRPPRKDGAPGRGDRGSRGRDGARRGGRSDRGGDRRPRSVNTAANEMRPGGVVSPARTRCARAA